MDSNNMSVNQNKKGHNNEKIIIGSALTGAAIGAAAVFLSDTKNQQKVKKAIGDATNKANKLKNEIKKRADSYRKEADKKIEKVEDDLKDVTSDAIETISDQEPTKN